MRTDDQWFQPGDKVMKVASEEELGLRVSPHPDGNGPVASAGNLFCVERCWPSVHGNLVSLVGFNDFGLGFYARCFRKVSEIQLCVRAAKSLSNPVEEENQSV